MLFDSKLPLTVFPMAWPGGAAGQPGQGAAARREGVRPPRLAGAMPAWLPPPAVHLDSHFAPPASLPASNQPGVWRPLLATIRLSPTLSGQLAALARSGWSIHWNQGGGSFCTSEIRRIDLDLIAPVEQLLQNLAHETSHAFDPLLPPTLFATDVAYADARMRCEALAVMNHLWVRAEILRNGGRDIGVRLEWPAYYQAATTFHGHHGNGERLLGHVKRMYVWELTSVHLRCYWEVYLNSWRTARGIAPVAVPSQLVTAGRLEAWNALAAEVSRPG